MNSLLRKLILKQLPARTFKRGICTTNRLCTFWERDDKGGYRDGEIRAPLTLAERMRLGLTELKKEIKLWSHEVKEVLESDPTLIYRPGEVDVAFRFKDQNSLDNWIVTTDQDNDEGWSNCSLIRTSYGKGLFSGNISLRVPKDGKIKRSGYCNIKTIRPRKSFKRDGYLDWTPYNMLVMKVRGDGRSYMINISTKGHFDVTWFDQYHYTLFTRGGPYWQTARIPFSRFIFSSKGRIQDVQDPIMLNKVTGFGITAADRYGGKFSLEIDYIGLEYDPKHIEETAYEMYKLPSGIAAV